MGEGDRTGGGETSQGSGEEWGGPSEGKGEPRAKRGEEKGERRNESTWQGRGKERDLGREHELGEERSLVREAAKEWRGKRTALGSWAGLGLQACWGLLWGSGSCSCTSAQKCLSPRGHWVNRTPTPTPGDYLGRASCWVPGSCGAEMLSLLRDCPDATDQLRQRLPLGLYVTGPGTGHAVRRGVTTGGSAMLGPQSGSLIVGPWYSPLSLTMKSASVSRSGAALQDLPKPRKQ